MAKLTMSASGMTERQAGDLGKKLAEAALAQQSSITKEAAQAGLEMPNIGTILFAGFRALAELAIGLVVRLVENIDRSRSPKQVLIDTGRKLYVDPDVVATMPRGKGDTAKLTFFRPDKSAYKNGVLSCRVLAEEYKKRGLEPDVEALADYNKNNPEAADKEPSVCQWTDADGNYCFAMFGLWIGERGVGVRRDGHGRGWRDVYVFAGVPQVSLASAV